MRFMMLFKASKESEAGAAPNPEIMAAIAKHAGEAAARGALITTGGLLPSSQGVRVRAARGKTFVIDGPFAETKELVGGFAIFDLESREEAIKSGQQFMQIYADILGPSYEGELEIRPMFDETAHSAGSCGVEQSSLEQKF
jgi:hypothetical protein